MDGMYKRDSEALRPEATLDVLKLEGALGVLAAHCVQVRIQRAALHDLPPETVTGSSNRPGKPVEIDGTERMGQVVMCSTCGNPQAVIYEDGQVVSSPPSKKQLGRCFRAMLEHEEFLLASAPMEPEDCD